MAMLIWVAGLSFLLAACEPSVAGLPGAVGAGEALRGPDAEQSQAEQNQSSQGQAPQGQNEQAPGPGASSQDDDDDNGSARCAQRGGRPHPQISRLAEDFNVEYDEVEAWFCAGYGLGEIRQVYGMSAQTGMPAEEIFDMLAGGMGLGEVKQSLGLIGNDDGNGNSEQ